MGAIIYTKRVNNQLVFSHAFLHISCLTEIHEMCNYSPTPSPSGLEYPGRRRGTPLVVIPRRYAAGAF